ncbi:MAG TPA: hypothetical protein VNI54_14390 [Thermoanaerobaculia bacterium]|nr:hypothetical protein [Thermoanaerobaculia bacterium]
MNRMESNNYRLERWLAFLLSLLFLLPFVAKADDIAFANASYHGDEMPYRNGEQFLAFTPECVLVPVKIQVKREHDEIVDNDGEITGKHVALPGFEDYTFILRGKNLHPGKVTTAKPDYVELQPNFEKVAITLGSTSSHIYYRCRKTSCALLLETNGVTQELVSVEANQEMLLELAHTVNFAGDLDHDGRLDLIVNASRHWNETRPTLFLSTAAKEGQLVGETASLSMTGC